MEDKRQEYSKNLTKMNRCNRIYNVAAIVYIGLFGFFMLEAFASSLFLSGGFSLFVFSLVCAVVIALGFMGAYKKNNVFALAAPGVMLIASVFVAASAFLALVSIALAAATFLANKDYEWLSQQEGFPLFSYHLKEYDEKKARNEVKTEYEEQYENYVSQSRNDMEVLPDTGSGQMAPKSETKNNYMDEL